MSLLRLIRAKISLVILRTIGDVSISFEKKKGKQASSAANAIDFPAFRQSRDGREVDFGSPRERFGCGETRRFCFGQASDTTYTAETDHVDIGDTKRSRRPSFS